MSARLRLTVRALCAGLGLSLGSVATIAARGQVEEAPYLPIRAEHLRELAERLAKEVVVVEVLQAAQEGSLMPAPHFDGGGIHVGGGRILTSAFLLRTAAEIRVRLPDGTVVAARAGKTSERKGLALLECDGARALPVPELATAQAPLIGATLYLHSNPGAPQPGLSRGYWVEPPGSAFYGRASLPARNGHPLYDVWGKVIGLAVLPAKAGLGSLVVPTWAIRKFLGLPSGLEASGLEASGVKPAE